MCTTLTPATAIARHNAQDPLRAFGEPSLGGARKVDITSPTVFSALAVLASAQPAANNVVNLGKSEDALPVDFELLVRVSPPLYINVIPSDTTSKTAASDRNKTRTIVANDMIENFMSSWTQLVGDPIVSKWIVLGLAVSIALNAYLLKGIGAGAAFASVAPVVRFTAPSPRESLKDTPSTLAATQEKMRGGKKKLEVKVEDLAAFRESLHESQTQPYLAPTRMNPGNLRSHPVNTLALDIVDRKLEETQTREKFKFLSASVASDSAPTSPHPVIRDTDSTDVKSLEDCIDMFENGPRPVSVSLSMLNDEEVILLSQAGKIQAYALEKMLGDLERAVRIRRALICKISPSFEFEASLNMLDSSSRIEDTDS